MENAQSTLQKFFFLDTHLKILEDVARLSI